MKCDILIMGLTLIIYGNFYVGISGCYTLGHTHVSSLFLFPSEQVRESFSLITYWNSW